jgi:hypothetical protein
MTGSYFPTPTPPTRNGAWPPRWCWRSCAPRWRCPTTPLRPRWGCSTSPTTTPTEAEAILAHLSAELPEVTDWAGTVGVGVAANNVEYFDEPALAVMLCDLSPDQYRVFSGVAPLAASAREPGADGFVAHTALVHADGNTPELAELIAEVAERTASGYVFGGLAASRDPACSSPSAAVATCAARALPAGSFTEV